MSNRLPVSVKRNGKGVLEFLPSSGGLATGLASYATHGNNRWIGWPGIASDDLTDTEKQHILRELKKHNCHPVFLTQQQVDDYYSGYSNEMLWPLVHNLHVKFSRHDKQWPVYQEVNHLFVQETLRFVEAGDTVWVHDYQLALVPRMLRSRRTGMMIGFFLHTPLPSTETLRRLPSAEALLAGILGADLAGFHTRAYVENFLDACHHFDVGTVQDDTVVLADRVVRVADFPIGIDYQKFAGLSESASVGKLTRALRRKYKQRRIILTVDRLDPSKGFIERLEAYREFLRQNPGSHGKVVMVMLSIPSRTDIKAYRELKEHIEALVPAINQEYGTADWQPIDYRYTTVPPDELAALYRVADVAFVAPLRDGMNLVAKEYIASQPRQNGVLVLSETAGAAQELRQAVLVNPRRRRSLVNGLSTALRMPRPELHKRVRSMQRQLSESTIQDWAAQFMDALEHPRKHLKRRTRTLTPKLNQELLGAFSTATQRTLLLDYDGTLAEFAPSPEAAKPDRALKTLLKRLAARPDTEVVLISGRTDTNLQDWFGGLPITLVAEHGAAIRGRGEHTWQPIGEHDAGWKQRIRPVLERYAARTPGAFVEEKPHALIWHFRAAKPYAAQKHATILMHVLPDILHPLGLSAHAGKKVIEVKPNTLHKGAGVAQALPKQPDFVLAVGDDYTDEDMFRALPAGAYSIKVGRGRSAARYRLASVTEVLALLTQLAHT